MATETKATTKTAKAARAKRAKKTSYEELFASYFQKFAKSVQVASDWCIEHDVPIKISPTDALRLQVQTETIRAAVTTQAGGQDNVPEAVLLYQQTLEDAAIFLLNHGLGRAFKSLAGKAQ